jgi:MFS family permease
MKISVNDIGILVVATLTMMGMSAPAPVLPTYAQSFGVDVGTAGWVITVFGLARFLTNWPAGLVSERVSHRTLLVAALAVTVLSSIAAGIATTWAGLLVARLAQGIGSGVYMTIALAVVATGAARAELGRHMALYQGAMVIGASIGPVLGGVAAEHFGLAAPLFLQAVLALISIPLVGYSLRSTVPRPERRESGGTRQSLDWRFFVLCYLTFSIFATRTISLFYLIPLVAMHELGFSAAKVGTLLAACAVSSFVPLAVVGPLVDRFGATRMTIIGNAVVTAALVGFYLDVGEIAFWVAALMLGVGSAILQPAVAALTARVSPSHAYGQTFGMTRMAGDAGFVLGPFIVGSAITASLISLRAGFLLNALFVGVGLAVAIIMSRSGSRRSGA